MRSIGNNLTQNQTQGFGEDELVTMLQAVYGVFNAAVVSACGMHHGESWRPFQAAAAEMAGRCVGKGLGAETTMCRPQRSDSGHACLAEVRAFCRIVKALAAEQAGRREKKINARLEAIAEFLPHESPSVAQYIAVDVRTNANAKTQINESRRKKNIKGRI
jgi:hypothetical protein